MVFVCVDVSQQDCIFSEAVRCGGRGLVGTSREADMGDKGDRCPGPWETGGPKIEFSLHRMYALDWGPF